MCFVLPMLGECVAYNRWLDLPAEPRHPSPRNVRNWPMPLLDATRSQLRDFYVALDDRALVSRILSGDRDRFAELMGRYERRIVNYVYRITRRYEDAHDLAQEIFVKVYLALDRYDPKYQFSTWLFRIAQNSAIDALSSAAMNISTMRCCSTWNSPMARPNCLRDLA